MWYWLFKHILIGPALRALGRPEIVGAHNIPATGPVILASNHLTVADSFFLILMVRRRITFVAKSEYFIEPGAKGALKRWFFTAVGQIPLDRAGADAAQDALTTARRILDAGGVWGIYPEGTRSPDGRLYRGRTGVARVALAAEVPVIPVAMFGTPSVNPLGSRLWRPGKVQIAIGTPIDLAAHVADQTTEQARIRAATDHLMGVIRRASGQEYVDSYAISSSQRS